MKYKNCCLGKKIDENIYNPLEDFKEGLHNAIEGKAS